LAHKKKWEYHTKKWEYHTKKNHNFFEFSSKIEGMAHKNKKLSQSKFHANTQKNTQKFFDFKNKYIE
jgi:hypothetical protein